MKREPADAATFPYSPTPLQPPPHNTVKEVALASLFPEEYIYILKISMIIFAFEKTHHVFVNARFYGLRLSFYWNLVTVGVEAE